MQLMVVGQVGLCLRHAMLLVVAERKNSVALVQIQNQNMAATLATEYREKNKSVQESLVRVSKCYFLLCDCIKFPARKEVGRKNLNELL